MQLSPTGMETRAVRVPKNSAGNPAAQFPVNAVSSEGGGGDDGRAESVARSRIRSFLRYSRVSRDGAKSMKFSMHTHGNTRISSASKTHAQAQK